MNAVFTPDIRFVYFDFDNVLAARAENRAALVGNLLNVSDVQSLRTYYMHGFRQDAELNQQYGAIRTVDDEVAFYTALFRQYAVTDVAARAARAFVNVPFVPDKQADSALAALSQMYRLGVLTNGLPSRHHELEASGLMSYFATAIVSTDYGIEKPDRYIYDKAAELAGVPVVQIALVDDEDANVRGAEAAGFGQAVLFTPAFWQQVM